MFGGFQPDAFQQDAYQNESSDAFQCIAFQPFAFQNSCEIQPADAFQCIAFQPFAFQASCEVDGTPARDVTGGWPVYGREPKRRKRPESLPESVAIIVEQVARRQVVTGPDLDPVQQIQELQAELGYDRVDVEVSAYLRYFKEVRKQLEEEKAVAMLLITLLS